MFQPSLFEAKPATKGSSKQNASKGMRKRSRIAAGSGMHSELADNARLVGPMGIPQMMECPAPDIPSRLVPFDRAAAELRNGRSHGYVHFFIKDSLFSGIVDNLASAIPILSSFDGILTPDFSLERPSVNCLNACSVFYSRAVGFQCQRHNIPVIPTVRWSDEASFSYCFDGLVHGGIVAVGTYGVCKSHKQQDFFLTGLTKMIETVSPSTVLVYGARPGRIFEGLQDRTKFVYYPDWTTEHRAKG